MNCEHAGYTGLCYKVNTIYKQCPGEKDCKYLNPKELFTLPNGEYTSDSDIAAEEWSEAFYLAKDAISMIEIFQKDSLSSKQLEILMKFF